MTTGIVIATFTGALIASAVWTIFMARRSSRQRQDAQLQRLLVGTLACLTGLQFQLRTGESFRLIPNSYSLMPPESGWSLYRPDTHLNIASLRYDEASSRVIVRVRDEPNLRAITDEFYANDFTHRKLHFELAEA